jgi:hypothetical protein
MFLNAPFDMRAMFLELSEHPEGMQKAMDDMMARWQKIQEEARHRKARR